MLEGLLPCAGALCIAGLIGFDRRVVLGQAALKLVARVDLHRYGELWAHLGADLSHDGKDELAAGLDRPAVLIDTAVEERRQKLAQQKAVPGVYLDTTEPNGLGLSCCPGVGWLAGTVSKGIGHCCLDKPVLEKSPTPKLQRRPKDASIHLIVALFQHWNSRYGTGDPTWPTAPADQDRWLLVPEPQVSNAAHERAGGAAGSLGAFCGSPRCAAILVSVPAPPPRERFDK